MNVKLLLYSIVFVLVLPTALLSIERERTRERKPVTSTATSARCSATPTGYRLPLLFSSLHHFHSLQQLIKLISVLLFLPLLSFSSFLCNSLPQVSSTQKLIARFKVLYFLLIHAFFSLSQTQKALLSIYT